MRAKEKFIKKWKTEYIAFDCFYLKPFLRKIYLKRKVIAFFTSMIVVAIGLQAYGIYWFYAVLLGGIIYPLTLAIGLLTFEMFSSWIYYRNEEIHRLLLAKPAYCPLCHSPLRTGLAKQCRFCFFDWH